MGQYFVFATGAGMNTEIVGSRSRGRVGAMRVAPAGIAHDVDGELRIDPCRQDSSAATGRRRGSGRARAAASATADPRAAGEGSSSRPPPQTAGPFRQWPPSAPERCGPRATCRRRVDGDDARPSVRADRLEERQPFVSSLPDVFTRRRAAIVLVSREEVRQRVASPGAHHGREPVCADTASDIAIHTVMVRPVSQRVVRIQRALSKKVAPTPPDASPDWSSGSAGVEPRIGAVTRTSNVGTSEPNAPPFRTMMISPSAVCHRYLRVDRRVGERF